MDRLECDRLFVAVMETGSFTAAATRLKISSGQASKLMARLEQELGVELLRRTTRVLAPTETGQAYYQRIKAILTDLDALDEAITSDLGEPTGLLRISAAEAFGRTQLAPVLPVFLGRHPKLSIEVQLSNRRVNLVEEGFDAAIRIGETTDSALIQRRLGTRRVATVASPDYLARVGMPNHPRDLAGHVCILDSNRTEATRWRYRDPDSGEPIVVEISGRLTFSDAEACLVAAEQGFGVTQVPIFGDAVALFSDGRLVPLLEAFEIAPIPVSVLYPPTRHLAPKVRALIDFLVTRFSGSTGAAPAPAHPS